MVIEYYALNHRALLSVYCTLCAGLGWRVARKILDVLMVLLHLGTMLVWSSRAYVVMDDVILAVLTPASMLLTLSLIHI